MSLLDLIKTTAMAAFQASNPVNIILGTVIESKPLKIEVHSKLILTDEFLLVAEHLTRHERILTVRYDFPKVHGKDAVIGDAEKNTSSKRRYIGTPYVTPYEEYEMQFANITFEDGLLKGDRVVLHRVQGGQEILCLRQI